jgi:hypothetical protein
MADGDTNALIAIAIILLILVIMYGGGCLTRSSAGSMVVQDKAVVTGPQDVAVAPIVPAAAPATTVANPAANAASKSEYQYDPNKPAPAAQVERLTLNDARNVISKSMGNARSLYKDITVTPKTTKDFLSTDRDIARLFRPVERCCGERLAANPSAEAAFQRAEKTVDPSYYTGLRKRGNRKNYKKERFVDANGRWQSFMYWKVGCEGDPRPKSLADRVDSVDSLPRVIIPESDVGASLRMAKNRAVHDRKERMSERQKLERIRGYVNDQGMWVRE